MDISNLEGMLMGTVLVPAFLAIFKSEILNFFRDYTVYKNRVFDEDGDPSTGQDAYIQSGATGKFNRVTVDEYKFGILASQRKVITHQSDPDGDSAKYIVVPYTYDQWSKIIKGSLQKEK